MRVDAPTAWAMEACCCAPTLGYGSTFPFVQFKPLGIGERIRAVFFRAQAFYSTRAANTVSCKETNHGRRKQVVLCILT